MTQPEARHEREEGGLSINERERRWVESQSIPELRAAIYNRLRPPTAIDDLEGRKPFLALAELLAQLAQAHERIEALSEAGARLRKRGHSEECGWVRGGPNARIFEDCDCGAHAWDAARRALQDSGR